MNQTKIIIIEIDIPKNFNWNIIRKALMLKLGEYGHTLADARLSTKKLHEVI